jgi:hypothetical protein
VRPEVLVWQLTSSPSNVGLGVRGRPEVVNGGIGSDSASKMNAVSFPLPKVTSWPTSDSVD